jgi:hypothetical protein
MHNSSSDKQEISRCHEIRRFKIVIFIRRERAPGIHWIGDWVEPRTVMDAVLKRKIPSPLRKSNPTTPIVQSVA